MLGSLVVAQMEMVACEGLDDPVRHGAGCASALQGAVAPLDPSTVPQGRGGTVKQGAVAPKAMRY